MTLLYALCALFLAESVYDSADAKVFDKQTVKSKADGKYFPISRSVWGGGSARVHFGEWPFLYHVALPASRSVSPKHGSRLVFSSLPLTQYLWPFPFSVCVLCFTLVSNNVAAISRT